jgi:hypothetical protein
MCDVSGVGLTKLGCDCGIGIGIGKCDCRGCVCVM